MIRTAFLAALLALGGCATCERHPDGCAIAATVATAVVIGSVAASQWNGGGCVSGCRHLPQVRVK